MTFGIVRDKNNIIKSFKTYNYKLRSDVHFERIVINLSTDLFLFDPAALKIVIKP